MSSSKIKIENLLACADVKINGDRPWDMKVRNDDLYPRIMAKGSLGLGEAYMDGWWDCESLDEFFCRILKANLEEKVRTFSNYVEHIKSLLFNYQKISRAFQIGHKHYDIGNELFKNMLDRRMVYSCGYWKGACSLGEAQEAKIDLICRKLGLKPGMKVLDIGCGWGTIARYAAEKYGVEVTGVTVSKEQAKLACDICGKLPVKIVLSDYRKLNGKFDMIFSIGMFEHVGYKNYGEYFDVVRRCLKDDGLFLLHTIASNSTGRSSDPWISKYIFTNSMLPSAKDITASIEGKFIAEDWHNFGNDYDKTLMAWYHNFADHWDKIKSAYDERFYRMWVYYLLCCAGSFRARKNQVWQIVLSPHGVKGGYMSVR